MKKAFLNCPDTGPLDSLVEMLGVAGYACYSADRPLLDLFARIGCPLTIHNDDLVRGMGYAPPSRKIPPVGPEGWKHFDRTKDIFVDLKAHRWYHRLVAHWPHLSGRVLWYRINGGEPEHVIKGGIDHGDEVNPPCPVLTPNQWYRNHPKAYTCYPPFIQRGQFARVEQIRGRIVPGGYTPPVCLIHGAHGWGYGKLIDRLRTEIGLRVYGRGSPDGLLHHREIPAVLGSTIAMVHLKSSDAPGYALYEALSAACPVIIPRRIVWRCRMQDLFPSPYGLYFDRETHDEMTDMEADRCVEEIKEHLNDLSAPPVNQHQGELGQLRLAHCLWSKDKADDISALHAFMSRHFGG